MTKTDPIDFGLKLHKYGVTGGPLYYPLPAPSSLPRSTASYDVDRTLRRVQRQSVTQIFQLRDMMQSLPIFFISYVNKHNVSYFLLYLSLLSVSCVPVSDLSLMTFKHISFKHWKNHTYKQYTWVVIIYYKFHYITALLPKYFDKILFLISEIIMSFLAYILCL